MNTYEDIFDATVVELNKIAKDLGLTGFSTMKKLELIYAILEFNASQEGLAFITGCFELMPDGYGFLRFSHNNYLPGRDDVYISLTQIKRFNLKGGHMVSGPVRSPKEGE